MSARASLPSKQPRHERRAAADAVWPARPSSLETLAPSLVLLGILPLLRLDGSPTRRPEIVDAPWDRISDVSLVMVGRRRMLRFTSDGKGSIDFRPDGDLVAAYQEFQGCIAAHRLHLPR